MCRDYPREITEARNKLWPHYRAAREASSKNKVSIRFPARLVVNGVTTHDLFPDWFTVMNGNRTQQSDNENNGHFNGQSMNGNSNQTGSATSGPPNGAQPSLISGVGVH